MKVSPQLTQHSQTQACPPRLCHTKIHNTRFRFAAKAQALTKEQRQEIARKAAAARWGKK